MSKNKEIIDLEKKLAQARKEAKKDGKQTLLVKEGEDFKEIDVKQKTLTKFEKAEIIDNLTELLEGIEYVQEENENMQSDRTGFWIKLMFLIDEPFENFMSIAFGVKDVPIPSLPNVGLFTEVVKTYDWLDSKVEKIATQLESLVYQKNKEEALE